MAASRQPHGVAAAACRSFSRRISAPRCTPKPRYTPSSAGNKVVFGVKGDGMLVLY